MAIFCLSGVPSVCDQTFCWGYPAAMLRSVAKVIKMMVPLRGRWQVVPSIIFVIKFRPESPMDKQRTELAQIKIVATLQRRLTRCVNNNFCN